MNVLLRAFRRLLNLPTIRCEVYLDGKRYVTFRLSNLDELPAKLKALFGEEYQELNLNFEIAEL